MIELYKDGDHMGIRTDCPDEDTFVDEISFLLGSAIDDGSFKGDWYFQLGIWIPQVIELCCKYRGYKTDAVTEQRVLVVGSVQNDVPCVASCKSSKGRLPTVEYADEEGLHPTEVARRKVMREKGAA